MPDSFRYRDCLLVNGLMNMIFSVGTLHTEKQSKILNCEITDIKTAFLTKQHRSVSNSFSIQMYGWIHLQKWFIIKYFEIQSYMRLCIVAKA